MTTRKLPRSTAPRTFRSTSRRSRSPVKRRSARAATQHSSTMSSPGSRQTRIRMAGVTVRALATNAPVPATRTRHCSWVILRAASSSPGTARYSSRSAGDTNKTDRPTSSSKAARGVPPNARAETMTPVSTTARSATSSGGHAPPPHLPHRRLDVVEGECRPLEGLTRHSECRFQPILGGEHRQNELLGGDTGRTTRHARVWCRAAVVVKATDDRSWRALPGAIFELLETARSLRGACRPTHCIDRGTADGAGRR